MRIAFSGTGNSGKTTLIKNFLAVWPQYKTPSKTYRDLIVEKGYQHSSKTTPEAQWDILNFMVDQHQQYEKTDKVVFDRCPLDNLAYTIWAYDKKIEGFTKEFVDKTIAIVRESLRHIDIIFMLHYDKAISVVDDGMRDTNVEYIKEVDNIFTAFYQQYFQNPEADIFFPKHDSPGIIELPTNPQRRIDIISEYIDPTGELYGEEHSILNPNNLLELEALVKQQKAALDQEEKEKELFKKFGLDNTKL